MIRDLLQREIKRGAAKKAVEPLVARLQRLLANPMAEATSWSDRHARPEALDDELHPAGGGLTLHDGEGTQARKSSELGFAYSRFVKRFGAPMPGQPRTMTHLLTKKAAEPLPGDLILFEAFEAD